MKLFLVISRKSYHFCPAKVELVINCENDYSENDALKLLSKSVQKYNVKSKTVSPVNGIEMTVEIGLKKNTTGFVNEISKVDGVSNVVLVSYNGDYMS